MDGNGGNPEMQSQSASLCKTGCGFYGNPVQEGLCSKCHKDKVKRLQQNSSVSPSATHSASSTVQNDARSLFSSSSSSSLSSSNLEATTTSNVQTPSGASEGAGVQCEEISDKTSVENVPDDEGVSENSVTSNIDDKITESACASTASDGAEANVEKPKRNRCLACNKKVGLTGFGCRCGGLFCSTHRYSDMHNCTFDYKELAQGQIRKNNPVVVGDKIAKI